MLQTVDEEEMTRESLINEDVVKFDEIVDKKTEDVELRNTENVDIKVQTDNESVVKSYAEHKEALEKIEIFKDNKDNGFDNSTDTQRKLRKFILSALQRRNVNLIDVKNV